MILNDKEMGQLWEYVKSRYPVLKNSYAVDVNLERQLATKTLKFELSNLTMQGVLHDFGLRTKLEKVRE